MIRRASTALSSFIGSPQRRRQMWYAPVLALALGIMMLRLGLLAAYLSPEEFGLLAFGLLVSSGQVILGAFGLQQLVQRDLPGLIVMGRETDALRLIMQTGLFSLACFLLLLPLYVIGPLFAAYPAEVWVIGLGHGLSQQLFLLATTESRSRGAPLVFAKDNLYRAILVAVLSFTAILLGYSALMILVIEAAASTLLSLKRFRSIFAATSASVVHIVSDAALGMLRLPWSNALFLMAASLLTYGLLNLDRWVASLWLDKVLFANYAFLSIGLMMAQSLQSLLNAAAFPMIARRHATKGVGSAFKLARNLSLACLGAGLIVGPALVLLSHSIIEAWFPRYIDTIPLTWTILILAVLRLSDFYSTYLLVTGHERTLTLINLIVLAVACLALSQMGLQGFSGYTHPLQTVTSFAVYVGIAHYGAVIVMTYRYRKSPLNTKL